MELVQSLGPCRLPEELLLHWWLRQGVNMTNFTGWRHNNNIDALVRSICVYVVHDVLQEVVVIHEAELACVGISIPEVAAHDVLMVLIDKWPRKNEHMRLVSVDNGHQIFESVVRELIADREGATRNHNLYSLIVKLLLVLRKLLVSEDILVNWAHRGFPYTIHIELLRVHKPFGNNHLTFEYCILWHFGNIQPQSAWLVIRSVEKSNGSFFEFWIFSWQVYDASTNSLTLLLRRVEFFKLLTFELLLENFLYQLELVLKCLSSSIGRKIQKIILLLSRYTTWFEVGRNFADINQNLAIFIVHTRNFIDAIIINSSALAPGLPMLITGVHGYLWLVYATFFLVIILKFSGLTFRLLRLLSRSFLFLLFLFLYLKFLLLSQFAKDIQISTHHWLAHGFWWVGALQGGVAFVFLSAFIHELLFDLRNHFLLEWNLDIWLVFPIFS